MTSTLKMSELWGGEAKSQASGPVKLIAQYYRDGSEIGVYLSKPDDGRIYIDKRYEVDWLRIKTEEPHLFLRFESRKAIGGRKSVHYSSFGDPITSEEKVIEQKIYERPKVMLDADGFDKFGFKKFIDVEHQCQYLAVEPKKPKTKARGKRK